MITQRVVTEAWTSRHTFDATRVKLPAALVKSQIRCGLVKLQERLAVLHDAY